MKLPRLNITVWILAGFLLGILTGLVFGDLSSAMKPLSEAFIKIWQITILPSVAISLIVGIGSLKRDTAKKIAVKAFLVILMIWVIGTIGYFTFQLAFPPHEVASFFSTQDLAPKTGISLIDEFIPSNPFSSLSEGVIPATVLFCLFLGFALMLDNGSGPIVSVLKILLRALENMTHIIAWTFPPGVFVITTVMAGTITIEGFLQLQVFLITLAAAAVLLGLVVLPLLVTCLTTFTYREILTAASRPMILAFSTGTEFITLPQISEGVEKLFSGQAGKPDAIIRDRDTRNEHAPGTDPRLPEVRSFSEILVPIAYTFPLLGGLVPFLFILFVAWMYNSPLDLLQQLNLIVVGIPSFFGSSKISVISLLDLMRLPADAYNLYISSGILRQAFVAPLSVISIFSFSVITIALTTGRAQFRGKRAAVLFVLFLAAGAVVIAGLNMGFAGMLAGTYQGGDHISAISLPPDPAGNRPDAFVNTTVYLRPEDVPPVRPPAATTGNDKLREIRERGSLRVGYNSNNVPFVFFNGKGELVGYDVEMAYDLARFLNVSQIEFVPIKGSTLASSLDSGYCDIVMAAVMVNEKRFETMKFSDPVVTVHLGFVVPDGRKDAFTQLDDVRKMHGVRIAAFNNTAAADMARALFPDAVIVPIETREDFFEKKTADALFVPAEEGYTLTLLYPFYDVAIIQPYDTYQIMYAYPIPLNSSESYRHAVNYWITTEKTYGMLDKKYDYWVLGNIPSVNGPRWSVLRNVLHWVK
ncbi:MAG: cation:dicarboxylase symporter family transporter [Methanoregula sp.]|nr:cation:dicarboxylase symporter family transporter [Methanoregula sp.]